jgi:hypothetical protein
MVQEVGYARLQDRGITLIAADSPNAFEDDTPLRNWCARCSARLPNSTRL